MKAFLISIAVLVIIAVGSSYLLSDELNTTSTEAFKSKSIRL